MNTLFRSFLIWIIPCFLLCGCATQNIGKTASETNSVEDIMIFSDLPARNFQVVRDIKATKFIDDFTSFESAENAALRSFKHQALKIGADGIIDVHLELFEDDELVASTSWKDRSKIDISRIESTVGGGCGLSASVRFKGKAIQFIP